MFDVVLQLVGRVSTVVNGTNLRLVHSVRCGLTGAPVASSALVPVRVPVCKAYIRGKPEAAGQSQDAAGRGPDAAGGGRDAAKYLQQSWRSKFRGYSHRAVEVAAERGTFTALRFPLHLGCFPHPSVRPGGSKR